MTEDYMNKDSLSVAVKTDLAGELKDWYAAFGWQIESEQYDKVYSDVTHMEFTRPHKIENKDRLQLLQVRFEMLLNRIAGARRKVNSDTGWLALILFILGAGIIVCGALLTAFADISFYLICGIIIIVAGAIFWIISAALCSQMRTYNEKRYSVYINVFTENIRSIVKEAAELTGYSNGNKEQQET